MLKAKVRTEVQVKISAAIANKYHLRPGDRLDAHELDGCIVFIPKRVKNNTKLRKKLNDILWSYLEQEAEDDIKAGRVAGPFETVEELLRDLRSLRGSCDTRLSIHVQNRGCQYILRRIGPHDILRSP